MTENLPPGLALAWGVQPVQRRGPKPALSVDRIVATGIEFEDRGALRRQYERSV